MKPEYTEADFKAAYDAYAIGPELRSPSNFWFVDVHELGLQPAPREILANGSLKSAIGFNEYGWTSIRKAPDGSYPHEPVDAANYVVVNHDGEPSWLVNSTTFVVKAIAKAPKPVSSPDTIIENDLAARAKSMIEQAKQTGGNESVPSLLTVQEVAKLFVVCDRTVIYWARQGKIPSTRTIGGHLRFRQDDVMQRLQPDK